MANGKGKIQLSFRQNSQNHTSLLNCFIDWTPVITAGSFAW
jgi:hypothetical protein